MEGKSESLPGAETSPADENSALTSAKQHLPSSKSKPPRRRTKTGCLSENHPNLFLLRLEYSVNLSVACRKRRIKCGEEKPICKNCIKSRRECLGYGQRVVFRPPVGPHPQTGPLAPMSNFPGAMSSTLMSQHPNYPLFPDGAAAGTRQPYLPLAPRPYPRDGSGGIFSQSIPTPFQMRNGLSPGFVQPGNASPSAHFSGSINQLEIAPGPTGDGRPEIIHYPYAPTTWGRHSGTYDAFAHFPNQGALPDQGPGTTYYVQSEHSPEV